MSRTKLEISTSSVGDRLRALIGDRKQLEFADRIGVHPAKLSEYLKGKTRPGIDFLVKLVLIGVNANWFLTGQGKMYVDAQQAKETPEIQTLLRELQGWEELAPALTELLRNMKEERHIQYKTVDAVQQLRMVMERKDKPKRKE